MRVVARDRQAGDRGFTLIELLVAMSVGLIVLFAAFTLLDRSFAASGQIADRTDALQRGRQAMDLITRQLRSQVCVGSSNVPMVGGTDSSVTFYADLSDGGKPIQKRTLTWDPTTETIKESVVNGAGTYPNLTFTGGATTATLLDKAERILDGSTSRAIFRYYGYKPGAAIGTLEQLVTPLSTTDLRRVAVIKIGFRAFPDRKIDDDDNSTVIEDDVYVRVADPNNLAGGPQCG
jgi:prepilin-type N-terminal cleavage/methylation domain-containing protein